MKIFLIIVMIIVIFSWISRHKSPMQLLVKSQSWYTQDYDTTDNHKNNIRSGLTIYVDYETGVQYVGTPSGGITPRIAEDGSILVLRTSK